MRETYDLLPWFLICLLLPYCLMWLVVPRKWLLSLPLLIYAIAMVFIADDVRVRYGGSDPFYSFLQVSIGIAITFVILLPLVEGMLRLCLIPFVKTSEARSRITEAVYWFAAGLIIPFTILEARLFSRYPGTILMPALIAAAVLMVAIFIILRRRGARRNPSLLLPGYSLGTSIMLAISMFYGAQVSSAAGTLAQDTPYCVRSNSTFVISMLDMTPLTLISRGISEYHAELIVETKPKAMAYNWSWRNLTFTPIPPDHMHSDSCSES
ncbi:hypothetical protein [Rhizobium sp. LjRoot254]|uniref:hypothetical protein n=1 Tax=Rhizobium sp. LjRoot254 TaxID=3342297 RepID=UPI003ECC2125